MKPGPDFHLRQARHSGLSRIESWGGQKTMKQAMVMGTIVTVLLLLVAGIEGLRFSAQGFQPSRLLRAYVANTGSDSISVLDLATDLPIGSPIPVGEEPSALVVSPDQERVYVANSRINTVSVIETENNQVMATIQFGRSSVRVTGLTLSLDGRRLFATHPRGNTVFVASTTTNAEDDQFPVSGRPFGLVWIDRSNPFLYISTPQDRGVTSADLFETRRGRQLIRTGPNPSGVTLSPDGDFVYVTDLDESKVSVISTFSNSVVSTFAVGRRPDSLALTPDGEHLIVASLQAPEASILNPTDGSVVATLLTGSSSAMDQPGLNRVAIAPDGLSALVANEDDDTVSIIDLKSQAVRNVVLVGDQPTGVVIVGHAAMCDPHPNVIDFGETALSEGRIDRELRITNQGTDTLQITQALIDNAAFQLSGMPRPLAPRETARFIVRFVSNTLGEHVGTLRFETNDPDPDRCIIRLRGVRRVGLTSPTSTHRERQ